MPADQYFVGAMYPAMFMDTFMNVADLPEAPAAEYSGVPGGDSILEMCRRLVSMWFPGPGLH